MIERRDQRAELLAAMTANLMNCWIKRPVTAARLLGRESPVASRQRSRHRPALPVNLDDAAQVARMREKLARQRGE